MEIFYSILTVAKDGSRKTEIVYKSNLTFKRATKYLEALERLGLIERHENIWKTSKKGLEFIRDFNKIIKRYSEF